MIKFIIALFLAAVSPVAVAQTEVPVVQVQPAVPQVAPCPAPAVLRKAAAKKASVAAPAKTAVLFAGWPAEAVWSVALAALLLWSVLMFILGRVTGGDRYPHVVPSVVHIHQPQPPPAPAAPAAAQP